MLTYLHNSLSCVTLLHNLSSCSKHLGRSGVVLCDLEQIETNKPQTFVISEANKI